MSNTNSKSKHIRILTNCYHHIDTHTLMHVKQYASENITADEQYRNASNKEIPTLANQFRIYKKKTLPPDFLEGSGTLSSFFRQVNL